MDQRFPDALEEDLVRCDNVCIICREEMQLSTRNKKLSCGHVFHLHCLRYICLVKSAVVSAEHNGKSWHMLYTNMQMKTEGRCSYFLPQAF